MQVMIPKVGVAQARYVSVPVTAGIPAENLGSVEWLSLDAYVACGQKDETLYVHVQGDSMEDKGIEHGDMLVVHLRPTANSGEAVLARLGGTFTVKNFHELEAIEKRRRLYLVPSNPNYKMRALDELDDFEIVGIVAYVLKKMR